MWVNGKKNYEVRSKWNIWPFWKAKWPFKLNFFSWVKRMKKNIHIYIYIYIIGTRYTLFNEIFYMEWLNRQVFALVKQWHIVLLLNHGRWRSYSGVSGWGRTAGCGDQRRGNVVAQLAGNFHQNRSHWLWRSTWRRKKSQNRKIDKVLLLLESYEG